MNQSETSTSNLWNPVELFKAIGPAIIVASVVLGPGSILIASRVGTEYGYNMLWVLAASVVLMISMVAICARIGVMQNGSMCDALAQHAGRTVTFIVGSVIFLMIACFQTSNNIAILAVIEPLFELTTGRPAEGTALQGSVLPVVILVGFNAFIIALLFTLGGLYKKLERLMKTMVMLMVVAFLANLIFARPSLIAAIKGLIPQFPQGGVLPYEKGGEIVDPLWAVQGMAMTTFSVAGAFYQGYLVREKGWTIKDTRRGLIDSVVGITTLGVLSAMIMMTSAAVLYGRIEPDMLRSISDVSDQIEPLFGPAATLLFSLGIFAGAFNPFIINAMIGGTIFSDSLGLGSKIDDMWPKVMTTGALMVGMVVALLSITTDMSTIGVIIFAQALTVLGVPVLAASVLYLATRPSLKAIGGVPLWMKLMCGAAVLLTLGPAIRTAWRLYLQLT